MPSSVHVLNEIFSHIQARCASSQTTNAYQDWIYRYFLFHQQVHPKALGEPEVSSFLQFLAKEKKVSQNSLLQAKQALVFLYREILQQPLGSISFKAKAPTRSSPTILSREEISILFNNLKGLPLLMVSLIYGCGLKLGECLELRIRDLDFNRKVIVVRSKSGTDDHSTIMPEKVFVMLQKRVEVMKLQHEVWLLQCPIGVILPPMIEEEMPKAARQFSWQFLFPSEKPVKIPTKRQLRITHISKSYLQKGLKKAAQASKLKKPVNCRILRQSFATHLLEDGYALNVLQKLLGYKTQHFIRQFAQDIAQNHLRVRSPLDRINAFAEIC